MGFKLKILKSFFHLRATRSWFRRNSGVLRRKRMEALMKELKRSPYYAPFIKEGRSLTGFPLMNKESFMQNFDLINTAGISREEAFKVAAAAEESRDFSPMINNITIGLSTGTSGNRGIFMASENERARWVGAVLDRIIGFSLRKRKVAFFLRSNSNLYTSVSSRLLKFHFYDIFLPMEHHVKVLNAQSPQILVAQPSMLVQLADELKTGRLDIHPLKVISVAEVLTDEDRKYLEESFGQRIHQVYQCTEGFLAATCKHGTLHFNEDFLVIEKKYIDEEKKRFHPVITDLFRITQPVIRYELNDIITEKKDCPCGSHFMGIEKIEGRADDVLIFLDGEGNEARIFPDAFRKEIILASENIRDYAVIQYARKDLGLYISSGDESAYLLAENAINTLMKRNNITAVTIHRIDDDPHVNGNKKRRIKNETGKTSQDLRYRKVSA